MITRRTVLILGAGASQHLGYPLGREMISRVSERIDEDIKRDRSMPCELRSVNVYPGFTVEAVRQFARHLERGVYSSIDEFLENNPDYIDLGKVLIARCLKRCEGIERLFPPKRSGWYHDLASSMLTDDPSEIPNAPLTIVSFNYDRSLEAYLHEVVSNRYRLPSAEAWSIVKKLKIIHPHGVLGAYPQIPYKNTMIEGPSFSKLAAGIRIIHELGDAKPTDFCSSEFRVANQALQEAEKILFLGFGFHEANLRRFKFFRRGVLDNVEVRSTCRGLETRERVSLITRLAQFGFQADVFKLRSDCNNFFRKVTDLD